MTIFFTKTSISEKKFVHLTFFSHFITLLLQILGGRMHGPSPPQILRGTVPLSPLSLRP